MSGIVSKILALRAYLSEKVLGFSAGADDYITKPFSVMELIARIRAVFRREAAMQTVTASKNRIIKAGSLTIDEDHRSVFLGEEEIDLTAREFDLLKHFASHPGRVFRRSELLDQVWGYGHDGYEHTVNSHINRLRAKIEQDANNPKQIVTIWGVGYKLETLGADA